MKYKDIYNIFLKTFKHIKDNFMKPKIFGHIQLCLLA